MLHLFSCGTHVEHRTTPKDPQFATLLGEPELVCLPTLTSLTQDLTRKPLLNIACLVDYCLCQTACLDNCFRAILIPAFPCFIVIYYPLSMTDEIFHGMTRHHGQRSTRRIRGIDGHFVGVSSAACRVSHGADSDISATAGPTSSIDSSPVGSSDRRSIFYSFLRRFLRLCLRCSQPGHQVRGCSQPDPRGTRAWNPHVRPHRQGIQALVIISEEAETSARIITDT